MAAVMMSKAQNETSLDSLYTPYLLNYLPANSPAWMAQLAQPHKVNYHAMVDSFDVYLMSNPEARRKTPATKQVVNHFRRFQKAYARYVQLDGSILLPKASEYRNEIDKIGRSIKAQRMARTRAANIVGEGAAPWSVLSPIDTYDYLHKKKTPAQANIQRLRASASNPEILYCGSETGMVFRSTDKGETWTPCNNGEWMAGEITTVDISSTNPDKVLVGGGGVYWLSEDGGDTWRDISPVKYTFARTSSAQFKPDNDNVIVAGDRASLYRSVDGGLSWEKQMNGMVFDVKFSRQNPDVCYVAIDQDNTVVLYKSSNGGATWQRLTLDDQLLISARIGLSDAPNGADYVYLWACRKNGYSQPGPLYFSGPPLLYKSVNGGESFEVMDPMEQMETVDKYGGQGYYDLVCTASATDPETVLMGIIQLYRSTDGGKTIENLGGYYGKFDLHCDMQSVQTNGNDTWLSTDGGVIYSNDFFAEDAQPKLHGLYASEMWGFDQGWNEDVMVGGRNHNGNMSCMDRYNGVSLYMRGSERATGYVFLSNPRKVAFSDSENVLMPDDWKDTFVPFLEYWTYPKETSQHGMGFEFDPRYAGCFYIVQGMSDDEYRTLWRTRDDGASFSTVYTFETPINAMAVSRSNPDKLVVCTWGRMFYSLDAGETFTEYMLPEYLTYSVNYKIAIHPTRENEIWVSDGNAGGFYRTTDNGENWEKLDDGLTFTNWEGKEETHMIGRFFLTGNEKNAVYAIAYTMGFLNEYYTTPRGRVLYRDDSTDGWVDYSEGLPHVINLNRMLPFYKNGVIRLATSNGIWQRALVDEEFKPVAQPIILNAGSGDNTKNDYPRTIKLDSYSIVNQQNAEWLWEINPAPLSMTSATVRNPVIEIERDQSYDISLTVSTPGGTDTKTITAMIKGNKPVPDATGVRDVLSATKDVFLKSGNAVNAGEDFVFVPQNIDGTMQLVLYDARGNVLSKQSSADTISVSTIGYESGVYFYMLTDDSGYKKTGKLLVRS